MFLFALGNERTQGHWSLVNIVKREVLLRDLHATSVILFPNANEKSVLQSLYLCLSDENPLEVEKINVNFPSRDQCLSLKKICNSFLMLHCRQMPWKCKYS